MSTRAGVCTAITLLVICAIPTFTSETLGAGENRSTPSGVGKIPTEGEIVQQIPDISGKWNSSTGKVYQITQSGNEFSLTEPGTNLQARGTIRGDQLTLSYTDMRMQRTVKGRITEYDDSGKPKKIVWEGGITFFRDTGMQQVAPAKGWCCKQGKVFQTTITECNKQGGAFFKTKEEAEAHCRDQQQRQPDEGWCCLDGDVFLSSKNNCEKYGGKFFKTRQEAEQYCKGEQPEPAQGWCCQDGNVFPASEEECRKRGGRLFRTRQQAEEFCRDMRPPEVIWCCVDGQVLELPEHECLERGGRPFPSRQEAEEFCRGERPGPEEGWCCHDGNVFPASEEDCRRLGGHFFRSRQRAEEFCREEYPEPEEGWCCQDAAVFPSNRAECDERGGQFFRTRQEAEEACRKMLPPEMPWCCVDGQVLQLPEHECLERGGRPFPSRQEAEEFCREERPEQGYCCLNGEVFPAGKEYCEDVGGRFFESLEEAEKYCRERQPREVWCCLDGQVIQLPLRECRERGGQAFRTREEAEEACRKMMPPEEIWCCVDGQVLKLPEHECLERGGRPFPSRQEAEEFCRDERPEQGYCCHNGEVFPAGKIYCEDVGGRFFESLEEAEKYCRERPPQEVWCCLEGRVIQLPIRECRERGGEAFRTREEAEERCREIPGPPEEGWCCLDGNVFPSTLAECEQRGGRFFPTCEEATRFCLGEPMAPPFEIIIGPGISRVTSNSAVISWETNRPSTGLVKYGERAARLDKQILSDYSGDRHYVTLSNLKPSTTYQIKVVATGENGEVVESRPALFETLPLADNIAPDVQLSDPGECEGIVTIQADASDNTGVERVEFYVNEELMFTDYSSSSPDYKFEWNTNLVPNGAYSIEVKAFDLAGQFSEDQLHVDVKNVKLVEKNAPYVAIVSPLKDGEYSGTISIYASLVDYSGSGLDKAKVYIDNKEIGSQSYPAATSATTLIYNWDSTKVQDGKRWIGVRVYDRSGKENTDAIPVYIKNAKPPAPQPNLIVTKHEVFRHSNQFAIELTVKNDGKGTASNIKISDFFRGFQPISDSKNYADYVAVYNSSTGVGECRITDKTYLTAKSSQKYIFAVMPVMIHPNPPTPTVGNPKITLSYTGPGGKKHSKTSKFAPVKSTVKGESIPTAHKNALKESDYLIVTNPNRLFALNPANQNIVNSLLSDMADLAFIKNGVLGYFNSTNRNTLRSLIRPKGGWAKLMHSSFSKTPGIGGYMLIVGETEIIPAWNITNFNLRWSDGSTTTSVDDSDHNYSDTVSGWPPDIIVGRIIGNDADDLRQGVRASIGAHQGWSGFGFDRSHALVVSGTGGGQAQFVSNVNDVEKILKGKKYNVRKIHWKDFSTGTQQLQQFRNNAPNRDVVYYRNHGGVDGWDNTVNTWDHPINFGNVNPFVFGNACLTGNYERGDDNNIAEAFFNSGASVYIGATEVSNRTHNNTAGTNFFNNWKANITIGWAFTLTERVLTTNSSLDQWWRYWATEYNIYGDPKIGSTSPHLLPTSASGSPMAAGGAVGAADAPDQGYEIVDDHQEGEPLHLVEVLIPDYEVRKIGEYDHVDIPQGTHLIQRDKHLVPIYSISKTFPKGEKVQEVIFLDRCELVADTGLRLPKAEFVPNSSAEGGQENYIEDSSWWPLEKYRWEVLDNSDGSSTLVITMFPFVYNPQTTDVRFWKNYLFDVITAPSNVEVTGMQLSKNVYRQDDRVTAEVEITTAGAEPDDEFTMAGEPQDVVVSALVKRYGTEELIDSLMLRTLKAFRGRASFTLDWDSGDVIPGYYYLELTLRGPDGNLLDRSTEVLRLGEAFVAVTDFSVTPKEFESGETIEMALDFENRGSVSLSGRAVFLVKSGAGRTVKKLTRDFKDLKPNDSARVKETWDTTGAGAGTYSILGYIQYDSKATEPIRVVVGTGEAGEGWCCADGRVMQITREECDERGGRFFNTREEAEEYCRSGENLKPNEIRPFEKENFAITSLTTVPLYPIPGERVKVQVGVLNRSEDDLQNLTMTFLVAGRMAEERQIGLGGLDEDTFEFAWTPNQEGEFVLRAVLDPDEAFDEVSKHDNSADLKVVVSKRPVSGANFEIVDLTWVEDEDKQQMPRVTVRNTGPDRAKVPVEFRDKKGRVSRKLVGPIEPGKQIVVDGPKTTDKPAGGFTAEVNPRFKGQEANAVNNVKDLNIQPMGDLIAEKLTFHERKEGTKFSKLLTVSFRIVNEGAGDVTGAFDTTIELKGSGAPLLYKLRANGLAAGKTLYVARTFNRPSAPFEVRVKVDSGNAVPEIAENNNLITYKFSGSTQQVGRWMSIGPSRIEAIGPLDCVGRTYYSAIDPKKTSTIYQGVVSPYGYKTGSGLWKSTDNGDSWYPITDSFESCAIFAIAVDPTKTSRVYTITPDALYRTDDKGTSWMRIYDNALKLRGKLYVNSKEPKRLVCTSPTGVCVSTDSGATWNTKLGGGNAVDLVEDPTNPYRLYGAIYNAKDSKKTGVYVSVDGGNSWRKLSGCPGGKLPDTKEAIGFSLAMSKGTLYIGFKKKGKFELYRPSGIACKIGDIYETYWEAGWSTTSPISNIEANHKDPNYLIAYWAGELFYLSTDGGKNFSKIMGNHPHVDQHGVIYDPVNPKIVYIVNDGGIYRSDNHGKENSWKFIGEGICNVEFYDIAISKTDPNLVIGGTQDNGTIRYTGKNTVWLEFNDSDGATCAINPTNAKVQYHMEQFPTSLRYIDETGKHFIGSGLPSDSFVNMYYTLHPGKPETLLACAGSLYRRDNARASGASWKKAFIPSKTDGNVSRVAVDASEDLYYVGTGWGYLYAGRDGKNWNEVFHHPSSNGIADIEVDPNNPRVVYLACGGSDGASRIYRLYRDAMTPTSKSQMPAKAIAGGLDKDIVVRAIAVDRVDVWTVYAATYKGIYRGRSLDNGKSWKWEFYNTGIPPGVDVKDLELHPTTGVIRAATMGRGAYELHPGTPIGTKIAVIGKITMLRVHDVGTKYGPPNDALDAEVIVRLDSSPDMAFGFKLRKGANEAQQRSMLKILRDAFNKNRSVRIEYYRTGFRVGTIQRVIEMP